MASLLTLRADKLKESELSQHKTVYVTGKPSHPNFRSVQTSWTGTNRINTKQRRKTGKTMPSTCQLPIYLPTGLGMASLLTLRADKLKESELSQHKTVYVTDKPSQSN
jgi:hypothetical protein